ncbi:MAG: PKD domain-containing protein [Saprospiraceae bacterium]|nr:PKD domain-containing protein [Saprospiraceae bacterium]
MITKYFIVFIFLSPLSLKAQFEDHNWILGYLSGFGPHTMQFDFNENELRITNYHSNYKVDHGNAIISTPDGKNILAMSNGYTIYNRNLDTMVNGGRINLKTAFYSIYGSSLPQSVLILNLPNAPQLYKVLYFWEDQPRRDSFIQVNRLLQATINIELENGLGRVIESDVLVDDDAFEFGKLQACRHANGRDWWIVIPRRYSKQILVYLLEPQGIRKSHEVELPIPIKTGIGQAQFSPDGTKYGISQSQDNFRQGDYLELFDFDRCAGLISNMKSIHIPDTLGSGGLAFSPDSRKLYFGTSKRIYQFDLTQSDVAKSKVLVGSYGGLIDSFFSGAECNTGPMVLAPDHKIYIATTTGTYWMHTIEYPDSLGAACRFKEGSLHLPSPNTRSVPSYPNFRLGPIDGSICDSLGIDNIPLARWRYEKNSTNDLTIHFRDLSGFQPTEWSWDFGDLNSGVENYSSVQHPSHLFSINGIYTVCLTARNSSGSHSLCKNIDIQVTNNADQHKTIETLYQLSYYPTHEKIMIQSPQNSDPVYIELINHQAYSLAKFDHVTLPFEISTVNWKPGIYYVRIYNKNIWFVQKLLII